MRKIEVICFIFNKMKVIVAHLLVAGMLLSFLEPEGDNMMALFFGRTLPLWTVGFSGSAAIIGLAVSQKNRKQGRR